MHYWSPSAHCVSNRPYSALKDNDTAAKSLMETVKAALTDAGLMSPALMFSNGTSAYFSPRPPLVFIQADVSRPATE